MDGAKVQNTLRGLPEHDTTRGYARGVGNGRDEGGEVAETFGEKKTLTLSRA